MTGSEDSKTELHSALAEAYNALYRAWSFASEGGFVETNLSECISTISDLMEESDG